MSNIILYTVICLGGIGAIAAIILYFVAQRFKVIEDPKIDLVEEALPGANCGGCGYAGCRAFAEAMVKGASLEGFNCPVGGSDIMNKVAEILGLEAQQIEPEIAVIRCSGSHTNAPKKLNMMDLQLAI